MDALTSIDTESRTCTLQAGMRSTRAEQLLGEHGFTLGHFPQSYEDASIGGYAATRAAGQASAGYGRFDEMVIGLVLATPGGTITLGAAQKSAAGPDLRELVMGSEGTLGVITEVTVRVHPAPEERTYDGWRFDSFEQGAAALRTLVQDGPVPTVLRLSDEAETAVNLADPSGNSGSGPGGCLSIAGYEGQTGQVAYGASKAAILGMSLPLARDLAPVGIRVCAIAPGTMGTPLMQSAPEEMKAKLVENIVFPRRMGEPEEFALLVESIVTNPYLNGENIRLDGALRFPPK